MCQKLEDNSKTAEETTNEKPSKTLFDQNFDDLVSQISFPPIQHRADKISHVRIFTGVPLQPACHGEFSNGPPTSPSPQRSPLPNGTGLVGCRLDSWEEGEGSTTRDSVIQHDKKENTGKKHRECGWQEVWATKTLQKVRAARGRKQKHCQELRIFVLFNGHQETKK